MDAVLFTARRVDWSEHAADEAGCDGIRYMIYTDGTVESGFGRVALSPEAFARLKALFAGAFCQTTTHQNAFDGEGWSMTLYAGNGHIIHETGLGYVYGVPVLEEIAAILQALDFHGELRTPAGGDADPLSPDAIVRDILQSMAAERRKGQNDR